MASEAKNEQEERFCLLKKENMSNMKSKTIRKSIV